MIDEVCAGERAPLVEETSVMCAVLWPYRWHRILWTALASAVLILLCAEGRADLISLVASDAVVVVGSDAAPAEVDIATEISERLRAAGGPSDNIVHDSDIHASLALAGYHHLILVGTRESNSVVAKCWSHFAAYPNAPWRGKLAPADTFFVFGFGDFHGDDVGYVECDQNPYWREVISLKLPDPGFRLLVKLTGSGPAGVLAAGRALLDRGLLGGVVAGAYGWESGSELWSLSPEEALSEPPEWLTKAGVQAGGHRIEYIGWQMTDSTIYAGLRELGIQPIRVHRAKYVTEKGLSNFDAAFHRRASANELMAVLSAAPDETAEKLRQALGDDGKWKTVTDGLWFGPENTYVGWLGDYVVVESFQEPWGELAMRALGAHAAKAVAPTAGSPG